MSAPDLRHFIEELNSRISLSGIVRESVVLHKKGREFQGLCPFHNEKTPSFYVNDEKGFYHCFGCGAHGDGLHFLEKMHRLNFKEALEWMSQKAGLPIPTHLFSQKALEHTPIQEHLVTCNQAAGRFFYHQLIHQCPREVSEYLSQRQINPEYLRYFGLGWAPSGSELLQHLKKEGFSSEDMIAAGLLVHILEENRVYSRFRDRLMFPIWSAKSKIIAFGARTLGDDTPKYLNSPESLIFHKGKTLYGLHWALATKKRSNRCIVAEGYMDVIRMHHCGFTESVAPLGTALSEEQFLILWKYWPQILLCFDGDKAGQAAALRAIERALPFVNPDRTIWVLCLPDKEDPDSFLIHKGKAAFAEAIASAQNLSMFLWNTYAKDWKNATPEAQAGIQKNLMSLCKRIQDEQTRRAYEEFFRNQLRQARTSIRPNGKGTFKISNTPLIIPQILLDRVQILGSCLLASLWIRPELMEKVSDTLLQIEFPDPLLSEIRDQFLDSFSQKDQHWKIQLTHENSILSLVNQPQLQIHLQFFMRTSDHQQLFKAWNEWFTNYQMLKNLETDLQNAHKHLHSSMDPSAWERVKQLQDMVMALRQESSSDI